MSAVSSRDISVAALLLLAAAILIESLTHPRRDAEITATNHGVKIEPIHAA